MTYTKRLDDGRYEYGDHAEGHNTPRGIAATYREARRLQGYVDFFDNHTCTRCKNGEKACFQGGHHRCEWPYPSAREMRCG